jgi:hypothetical protein
MSYEAASPATSFRSQRTKLTPERIEQIKELIASGVSCEDIAAKVGVTVGTLKVSCSRLGDQPPPAEGTEWKPVATSCLHQNDHLLRCEVYHRRSLPRRRTRH